MQEAKSSCYGSWYLPAGRMERNESIVDAVKREVLEETGLEFTPSSLVALEISGGGWFRFTFAGCVTGGKLKTLEEKDDESLQAKWVSRNEINMGPLCNVPLRAPDILPLIDITELYRSKSGTDKHSPHLPIITPHERLILRTLFVYNDKSGNEYNIVIGYENYPHLPCVEISPGDRSIVVPLGNLMLDIFGAKTSNSGEKLKPDIIGVLSVEHDGCPTAEHDGICITVLVHLFDARERPTIVTEKYNWHTAEDSNLKTKLFKTLANKLAIPLISHR